MQKSTRDALVTLPIAFIGMFYLLISVLSLDGGATAIQWTAGLGGIFVCLLFMFQTVKSLMHDLSNSP